MPLIGLAAGLLAFCAGYVKDPPVESFKMNDRIFAGVAAAGAFLSLAIGAVRTWLYTRLYRFELSDIDYRKASALGRRDQKQRGRMGTGRAGIDSADPKPFDDARVKAVGIAVAEIYDRRFDALALQAKVVIAKAHQLKGLRRMEHLAIPQIVFLIVGALALAAIVFRQLAA